VIRLSSCDVRFAEPIPRSLVEGCKAEIMNNESTLIAQTARRRGIGERRRADAELDALCESLKRWILEGTMPPDDAYWWTRIVAGETGIPAR
jgi:hypothetical protein